MERIRHDPNGVVQDFIELGHLARKALKYQTFNMASHLKELSKHPRKDGNNARNGHTRKHTPR